MLLPENLLSDRLAREETGRGRRRKDGTNRPFQTLRRRISQRWPPTDPALTVVLTFRLFAFVFRALFDLAVDLDLFTIGSHWKMRL